MERAPSGCVGLRNTRQLGTAYDAHQTGTLEHSTVFGSGVRAEPNEFSLLHALFYIHSGGGFESLTNTRGGAQQDRFVEGAQSLALKLAAHLGERVRLNQPVMRIQHSAQGVCLTTRAGATYAARAVIVAIPPTLAGRIEYDPPLPAVRDQLTQRLPNGAVIKCFAVYDRPFWREQGLSGFAVMECDPVHLVFDNSPPDASCGILLGFIEGAQARQMSAVDPAMRCAAVLECLRAAVWRSGAPTRNLHRPRLERRGLVARVLRGALPARRVDAVRTCFARAYRTHLLGRHRDRHALDGVY
jgi:monoamine oxidase